MIVRELITKLGFNADTKEVKEYDSAVSTVKTHTLALVAATTAAAAAIFGFVESAAAAGDRLDKMQAVVGLTAKQIQLLEGAAGLAGVEQDSFSQSMQFFAKALGMSRMGMLEQVKAFKMLGISTAEINDKSITQFQLLLKVADGFQNKLTNAADRATVAQLLFSRSGGRMINMFQGGSKGIQEMMKEIEKYSFLLTKKAIRKSRDFQDSLLLLKTAVTGFKNELGIALMPVVQTLINRTLKWIMTNRELIKQDLVTLFKDMISALSGFKTVLTATIGALSVIVKLFRALERVLGPVTTLFISLAIAANSFLDPILAIPAALILVLDDVNAFLEGKDSLIGRLVKKFPNVTKAITKGFGGLKGLITIMFIDPFKILMDLMKGAIKLIESMKGALEIAFVDPLKDALKLLELIIDKFKTIAEFRRDVSGAFNLAVFGSKQSFVGEGFRKVMSEIDKFRGAGAIDGGQNAIGNTLIHSAAPFTKSINAATNVTVTVPPGTEEDQKNFLNKAATDAFDAHFTTRLMNAFNSFPQVEQ